MSDSDVVSLWDKKKQRKSHMHVDPMIRCMGRCASMGQVRVKLLS